MKIRIISNRISCQIITDVARITYIDRMSYIRVISELKASVTLTNIISLLALHYSRVIYMAIDQACMGILYLEYKLPIPWVEVMLCSTCHEQGLQDVQHLLVFSCVQMCQDSQITQGDTVVYYLQWNAFHTHNMI